jgi:hypothetical protein
LRILYTRFRSRTRMPSGKSTLFASLIAFLLFFSQNGSAQNFFNTAASEGFGSASIMFGGSIAALDTNLGDGFDSLFVRGSVGIGLKTDIFGSLDWNRGREGFNPHFYSWTAGLKHTFIHTGIVDIGSLVRLRNNRTDNPRFESSLLDFAGIISVQFGPVHPYYAILFSHPFGFDLNTGFQTSSVMGAEIPLGTIPRIFGEVSLGDRRSAGVALRLAF